MRRRLVDRILVDLASSGVRLGLSAERRILAALGDPQRAYGCVLVAGTNGKGSSAALLASMASAAGYRCGLYTSPHLERAPERIRVDGATVRGAELGRELVEVVAVAQRETGSLPTHFEALTAAALRLFERHGVELAILEVGLGGRLDATNVVEPVLSVITDIGLDHREYLGETLEEIAREKAGILRAGGVAVAAPGPEAAAREIERLALEVGTELRLVSRDLEIHSTPIPGWAGQRVTLTGPGGRYKLRTRLLGGHQAGNLALAVRSAETLRELGWAGFERSAIVTGAQRCRWPGRLERVTLPDRRSILLDVAHNAAGVERLVEFLDQRALRFDLLFGALKGKRAQASLAKLATRATAVVLTSPPSPRAIRPELLAAALQGPAAVVEADPGRALDRALALRPERTLVVCGSVFLVGAVRRLLRARCGVPPPATEPLF